MQKLDPPGVGARDLKECLLLQLTPGMDYYEQLKTLISNHLEDLEHNRLPQIERKTGYSMELIKETLEQLAAFESRSPGPRLRPTYVQPVRARRVRRTDRRGRVQSSLGRWPHAEFVHQPVLSQTAA